MDDLIKQREKIYGDFGGIADVSQQIKNLFYVRNTQGLNSTINEAFDMIAHKLARIANNGAKYIDNWRDIVGYAQLVVNYLEKEADEALDSKVVYLEKKSGTEFKEVKLEEIQ